MSQSTKGTVQVTLSEVNEDVAGDAPDAVEQAREEALEGGARYRGRTGSHHPDESTELDTECRNCESHVSQRFARVMGDRGVVHACINCVDNKDIQHGAAAGLERRDTL